MPFAYENKVLTSYGFRDNNDNVANSSIYHVSSDDLADVLDNINALEAALNPITDAQLFDAIVSRYASLTEAAPPAVSDVRRKLFLVFNTSDRLDTPTFEVPSPVAAIEQFGSNIIDPAQPLVAALVAALSNPLGTGSFVSRQGRPLLSLKRAYIGTRQRNQP